MNRLAVAVVACVLPFAAHAASVVVSKGATTVVFAQPGGGENFDPAPGSTSRYIFTSVRDSAAGQHKSGARAFDQIVTFYPGDVIDIAALCNGSCKGPVKTDALVNLAPATVYYWWTPSGPWGGPATIVCLSPCRAGSFWLPLENGELQLTRRNFAWGAR